MKHKKRITIVAWNSKTIYFQRIYSDDFNEVLAAMSKKLGHRGDDPRWMEFDGWVGIKDFYFESKA